MRIGLALRDRPLKYDLIAWPVVGMGDVEQVEPQKILARAADDLAEAVVDRSEDAIQIDLAETGHGLRDERRKLLLVLPHGKFAIAHLPSDPHRDPDKRERRHRREQRKADRKSTRLNSSHLCAPRMPSSA